MSVNYKAMLAFGAKFSHKEAQEMLINCDYKYEDDFIPIDAWADPDEMEYIFGYEVITCGMGESYSFTNSDFPYFTSSFDVEKLTRKLREMGVSDEAIAFIDFNYYIVGQVS